MDKLNQLMGILKEYMRGMLRPVFALSCVVVLAVICLLIFPASALDKESAEEQGGIETSAAVSSEENENTDADNGDSEASDKENTAENAADNASADAEDSDASADGEEDTSSEGSSKASRGLESMILASNGKNYKISVTCGADAGVPEGADLSVTEITADTDTKADTDKDKDADDTEGSSVYAKTYEEYVSCAEDALGMEEGSAGYIRLFDIKIVDENGEKIQPAEGSKVDVEIKLVDAESDSLSVVHFAENEKTRDVEPEVLKSTADGDTVSFKTEGFSVYAVVEVDEPESVTVDSTDDLDGNYFVIVSDWQYIGKSNYLTSNSTGYLTSTASLYGNEWRLAAVNKNNASQATVFRFEKDSESGQFYISYVGSDGVTYYFGSETDSWSYKAVTSKDDALLFTVTVEDEDLITISCVVNGTTISLGNYGSARYQWDAGKSPSSHDRYKMTVIYTRPSSDDQCGLDGKTYGIAFDNNDINATALMSSGSSVTDLDVLIRPDVLDNSGTLLVAPGSDITKWTFTHISEDKYYIQDEEGNYLSISSSGVTLKSETDDSCVIKIEAGTGTYAGKIRMSCGNYALGTSYRWDNTSGYTFTGFKALTTNDRYSWFCLADDSVLEDDDFTYYTAKKVSVSDEEQVYDSQQIVIYTRVWNEDTKSYEYYAVDHDGSLLRCYSSGDNIEWVGSNVNTALWNFSEGTNSDGTPSYYYWLQNTQYPEKCIVPKLTTDQNIYTTSMADDIKSDFNASVNLNGRRLGQTYTTIICWDDDNYAYAGLKVENGKIVPCPLSESDDFYFAIIEEKEDEPGKLSTVDTIDNDEYGITMKMQDYPYQGYYISGDSTSVYRSTNGGYRSETQANVLGYDNKASSNGSGDGLLSTDIKENGYPTAVFKGESLYSLYSEATTANHLFLKSTYDETGYFEYDSTQNFAQLGSDGNFTVYDQLAAAEVYPGRYNYAFHAHGMFLPYNDITSASYSEYLTNWTDMAAQELPDTDPRKGENLYCFNGQYPGHSSMPTAENAADYFFGMELGATFTQTPSGLDAWGHDIIFEFSGDDDFWFYVDGELVVDLGGVRAGTGASGGASTASVNFRTGEVIVNGNNTTIYDLFKSHYDERVAAGTMTQAEEDAKLAETFTQNSDGQYVFTDYSNHEMKIYYMERGAGASNLHLKFNLAAVKPGTVELSKALSGTDSASNDLIEFPYQIYYKSSEDNEYHLLKDTSTSAGGKTINNVTYKDTVNPVKYKESLTVGGTEYSDVFMLKPGETAVIQFPSDTVDYYIVECGVNTSAYDVVKANGTELTGRNDTLPAGSETTGETGIRQNFNTTAATTDERPKVEYDNHVKEGAMRTLSITKKLYDSDGETEIGYDLTGDRNNETLFEFRLYLGNEYASSPSTANLYPYYVKDSAGEYCYWDAENQKFAAISYNGSPVTDYSTLSEYLDTLTSAQKETIIFRTSMNGAISRIPAGYTVEVRDLLVGTAWKTEERDWNIPKGYTRREGDGYVRTDLGEELYYYDKDGNRLKLPEETDGIVAYPAADVIAADEDPAVQVRNQKGWGLTVEKVWTDKDFMDSHDPIYFAVYLNSQGDEIDTNDTLIEGTVRQLSSGDSEIYYYFDDLYAGTDTAYTFDRFVIREVTLTKGPDFAVSDDGVVTGYDGITPIYDNGTLTVGGKPSGSSRTQDYSYTVTYEVGETTGKNENIRTDTVTNSRPGIKIYKTLWDGTTPLANAVFTLKDSGGNNVAAETYTSRSSDGLVTIAYLDKGKSYTLTEIQTPQGYISLDEPMTIKVKNDDSGTIEISGPDSKYYICSQATDTDMASIIVRNRPVTLEVKKYRAGTNEPLADVHFALYRQVTDTSGTARKDYLPMDGYDDLVTDENGILEKVNMQNLTAGTYYLTETKTLDGLDMLEEDLCFTIGKDGRITIVSGGDADWISEKENESDASHNVTITISVPNGDAEYVLPETGGMGTTIFYVIGSILVLGGGILLAARRLAGRN